MTYRTPEKFIYQGILAPRSPAVSAPCSRCGGKRSTAAKAAGSEVCSTCASDSAEQLTAVPLMALTPFRGRDDWHWIIDRYLNNGSFKTQEDWASIYANQSVSTPPLQEDP